MIAIREIEARSIVTNVNIRKFQYSLERGFYLLFIICDIFSNSILSH
jgi:hypothetical protein